VRAGIIAPSRDTDRGINIELYESTTRDLNKPTPVLVNMHGSGFVIPSLGTDAEFCALVAARTPCVVFDTDYRKSPEHPLPAPMQDIEDVLAYIAANSEQFDVNNIFLSGFFRRRKPCALSWRISRPGTHQGYHRGIPRRRLVLAPPRTRDAYAERDRVAGLAVRPVRLVVYPARAAQGRPAAFATLCTAGTIP